MRWFYAFFGWNDKYFYTSCVVYSFTTLTWPYESLAPSGSIQSNIPPEKRVTMYPSVMYSLQLDQVFHLPHGMMTFSGLQPRAFSALAADLQGLRHMGRKRHVFTRCTQAWRQHAAALGFVLIPLVFPFGPSDPILLQVHTHICSPSAGPDG